MRLPRPLVAAAALLLAAPAAKADPITVGRWYAFGFGDAAGTFATAATSGCTGVSPCTLVGAPPWTFASAGPVAVTIQDMQRSIDQFSLLDFGSLVGTTPAPTVDSQCGLDLDACLLSPDHSRGVFALGAGAHSLTIRIELNTVAGTSAFRVDPAAVLSPEPATVALLAGGLGLLGGAARRRA